jgi:RNA polymerase sigma factor (sigma-70 family)
MNEASDAQLMARVRSGDRDAFGMLVRRHKDSMVNYLTRLTGCRERAEDAAQETFVRLYRVAPRYSEQGRFAAYLYRIATNLVRQHERRERRRRVLSAMVRDEDGFHPDGNGHRPPSGAPGSRRCPRPFPASSRRRRPALSKRMIGVGSSPPSGPSTSAWWRNGSSSAVRPGPWNRCFTSAATHVSILSWTCGGSLHSRSPWTWSRPP